MALTLHDMLRDIEDEVRYTRSQIGKNALDTRVMQAMERVPRDQFVSEGMKLFAYENGPLPIGHGQTISQPYIVALMTDMLALQPEFCVLEIGTGSGYQTAILSLLCKQVYSLERIPELNTAAIQRFQQLGYHNIETRVGNGYDGWPEHAPYDGIIVTAAAAHIPDALVTQLKPGGRMVIPVGSAYGFQELMRVKKDLKGRTLVEPVLSVSFVPLINAGTGHDESGTNKTETSPTLH
jgi:protein-L-isoaspartate(D-aspartate) O-methyltransferase